MSLKDDIRQVEQLKGSALRERFREVMGVETRSNNRPYLIKSIVKKLEERQASAPSSSATQKATAPDVSDAPTSKGSGKGKRTAEQAKASARSRRKRDPRLPPAGTPIEREYEGKTIKTKELEDGTFPYNGQSHGSLSAVAKAATGTVWNGFLFFKEALLEAKERAKQAAA